MCFGLKRGTYESNRVRTSRHDARRLCKSFCLGVRMTRPAARCRLCCWCVGKPEKGKGWRDNLAGRNQSVLFEHWRQLQYTMCQRQRARDWTICGVASSAKKRQTTDVDAWIARCCSRIVPFMATPLRAKSGLLSPSPKENVSLHRSTTRWSVQRTC